MISLSLKDIEFKILEELKDRANDYAIEGEHVISSTIFTFLDEYEQEKLKKIKRTKIEKEYIIVGNKSIWKQIQDDYDIGMHAFNKKISKFVKDNFKRKIILRDIAHAYIFANTKFYKEAVILSGGVIEELLRYFLQYKKINITNQNFNDYIRICEHRGLLQSGINRLSDFVRQFRNLVHLEREKSEKHTITKPIAKGAVSSIFAILNDFGNLHDS